MFEIAEKRYTMYINLEFDKMSAVDLLIMSNLVKKEKLFIIDLCMSKELFKVFETF